jgi:hypothetical protein
MKYIKVTPTPQIIECAKRLPEGREREAFLNAMKSGTGGIVKQGAWRRYRLLTGAKTRRNRKP